MCKELLAKMPKPVVENLKFYKSRYNMMDADRKSIRSEALAYTNGLKDSGLITEVERRSLFLYVTV